MKEMTARVRGSELKRSRKQNHFACPPADLEDLEEECSLDEDEDEDDVVDLTSGEKELYPSAEELHFPTQTTNSIIERVSKRKRPMAIDIDDANGRDDVYLVE